MLRLRDILVSRLWYASSSSRFFVVRTICLLPHYLICIIFGNDLSVNVKQETPVVIYHALGIVVGSGVEFGKNVVLRARVTLGEDILNSKTAPKIGDNVQFGIGSSVFGDVFIPSNRVLKANKVYTKKNI